MTRAQKQHAKEQRALLQLRKAAVVYSVLSGGGGASATLALAFADLTAACDRYAELLPNRERLNLLPPQVRNELREAMAAVRAVVRG